MTSALSTQCAQIRAHLESGRGITQADAIDLYGCFRLGARIHDLRQEGLDIVTTTRTAKNRYGKRVSFAEYRIGGSNEHLA